MKGKLITILLIIFFIPVIAFAAETCNPDDVKITSIELSDTKGNVEEVNNATGDNNKVNIDLKMNVPGDTIEYKLVLNNTSNEDFYFDESTLNIDKDNLNYEIIYDDGTDIVGAGQQKTVYLRVSYNNKIEATNLSNGVYTGQSNVTINLSNKETNPKTGDQIIKYIIVLAISIILLLTLFKAHKHLKKLLIIVGILSIFSVTPKITNAVCKCILEVESNIQIDAKEAIFLPGVDFNIKIKELAGDDTSTSSSGYNFINHNITAIKKSPIEPDNSSKEDKNIVSTADSPYPIYVWFDNGTIYWWSEDDTPSLNEDASCMFIDLSSLIDISGLKTYDVTNTKYLDKLFILDNLDSLQALKEWNVSNVESLAGTFQRFSTTATDLSGLENWNTSKVTNMSNLFYGNKLLSLNGIENWNTSNVTILSGLVESNVLLTDMSAIKDWDVSKVTTLENIFSCCYSLEEIDLSNWNAKSLENMSFSFGMLYDGNNSVGHLKRIILSNKFDTSKVTDMHGTFYNNRVLENYEFVNYLDTSSATDMTTMFYYNFKLDNLSYFKNWDVSNVENMLSMFIGCRELKSLEGLENWDVSNVLEMSYMFYRIPDMQDASAINDWDISQNASFNGMFGNTPVHPDFSKVSGTWNNGTFTPTP